MYIQVYGVCYNTKYTNFERKKDKLAQIKVVLFHCSLMNSSFLGKIVLPDVIFYADFRNIYFMDHIFVLRSLIQILLRDIMTY